MMRAKVYRTRKFFYFVSRNVSDSKLSGYVWSIVLMIRKKAFLDNFLAKKWGDNFVEGGR